MTRRVGALDLGTNAALCTVAELDERPSASRDPAHPAGPPAELVILEEHETITRLGEGVDRTRALAPEARARTLACLRGYRARLDALGVTEVLAVGTSALRDAAHGPEFARQAEEILDAPLEIVSGAREAELTFWGALSGLELDGPVFVFDIGGGSTELVWGQRGASATRIDRARSLDIGSVRLFERLAPSDPPTPDELEELRAVIRAALLAEEPQPRARRAPGAVLGVAGTVTSLVELHERVFSPIAHDVLPKPEQRAALSASTAPRRESVHGRRVHLEDLRRVTRALCALPLAERSLLPHLDPRRADVIVCGAILCEEILAWVGAEELLASDRGVRFGLLEEWRRQRSVSA